MMQGLSLVDADRLAAYADHADAAQLISNLVGQLVTACPGTVTTGFRSGSGLQIRGWDGTSDSAAGDSFVPKGITQWEVSKQSGPEGKAEKDYAARLQLADKSTSYVAVTLRRWGGKDDWAQRKNATGRWKSVRALDADDLLLWLQKHPEIHRWVTERILGLVTAAPLTEGPRQIPPRLQDFVGREIIISDAIRWVESSDPGGSRTIVISGLGGMGKTTLAAELAARIGSKFPRGHVFLNLGDGMLTDPLAVTAAVRTAFAGTRITTEPGLVQDEQHRGLDLEGILLVLDNVEDEHLLESVLPLNAGSLAIVTSRREIFAQDDAYAIHLNSFEPDESIEFLLRVSGSSETDSAAKVAALCGNMPLALRIAARMARRSGPSGLQTVANQLTSPEQRLDELRYGAKQVNAVFALAFDSLTRTTQRLMASLVQVPGKKFDADLAAAAARVKTHHAAASLRELSDRYLIENAGALGLFRFHPLIELFVKGVSSSTTTNEERVRQTTTCCSLFLNRTIENLLKFQPPEGEHATTEHIRNTIEALDRNWDGFTAAVIDYPQLNPPHQVAILGALLGPYCRLRLQAPRLRDVLIVSCTAASEARKSQPRPTTETLRSYALARGASQLLLADLALDNKNTIEATGHIENALNLARQISSRELVSAANTTLGHVSKSKYEHKEALRHYREARRIALEAGNVPMAQANQYNIGNILRELGQLPEALSYLESDLAHCKDSGDKWGEAVTRNVLGIVLCEDEDFEGAVQQHLKSRAIYTELGDKRHASEVDYDLGVALVRAGRSSEALPYLVDDLAYCESQGDLAGAAITELLLVTATADDGSSHDDVAERSRQCLARIRACGTLEQIAAAQLEVAQILAYTGHRPEAMEHFDAAIDFNVRVGRSYRAERIKSVVDEIGQ